MAETPQPADGHSASSRDAVAAACVSAVQALASTWAPDAPVEEQQPGDEAPERRGVSLAFLRAFAAALAAAGGGALTTLEVVDGVVRPCTEHLRAAFSRLVPHAFGSPVAFASHAWGNPFSQLVELLSEHYSDAPPAEVFVWVDVFAVNQHNPSPDLDNGRALARTIERCAEVTLLLDGATVPPRPLTRLWCLFELSWTPPAKLVVLSPPSRGSASARTHADAVDVEDAQCGNPEDAASIRAIIVRSHGSQAALTHKLRALLLLAPGAHGATGRDTQPAPAAPAERSGTCEARQPHSFAALRSFLDSRQRPFALVRAGPGAGKSELARALCAGAAPLVHASHSCDAGDGDGAASRDAALACRSLAYQLALQLPPMARFMACLSADMVAKLHAPHAAWDLLLAQPLKRLWLRADYDANDSEPRLPAMPSRIVFLFDDVDAAGPGLNPILRLVLRLGRLTLEDDGLRARIGLVVMTRPDASVERALRLLWRGDDLHEFAPAELLPPSLRHDAETPPLLLLLNGAWCGPELNTPPRTLDAAYAAWFAGCAAPAAPLLSVIAAARAPPSVTQLAALRMRHLMPMLPGWGVLFFVRGHRLHTVQRSLQEWLHGHVGVADVAAGHAAWASHLWESALRPWLFPEEGSPPAPPPPRRSYAYAHALAHLQAAGRARDAERVLLRLSFLRAALRELRPTALLAEVQRCARASGSASLRLLHGALLLSAPALQRADGADALPTQLLGRLHADAELPAGLQALLAEAAAWRSAHRAWVRPLAATMRTPGGCFQLSLGGHDAAVQRSLQLADGRLATIVYDRFSSGALHVWDVDACARAEVIQLDLETANAVLPLRDGRLATFGHRGGRGLQLWDTEVWACSCSAALPPAPPTPGDSAGASDCGVAAADDAFDDHRATVVAAVEVSVAAAGEREAGTRIVAACRDGAVRVWDPRSAELRCMLRGHTDVVSCLAQLPRSGSAVVVTGSYDTSLRVWSIAGADEEDACVCVLSGHGLPVSAVVALPDGLRCVSAARGDPTARVWDVADGGVCLHTLRGHAEEVLAVAALPLPCGLVATASADKTVRLWGPDSGACSAVLAGHHDAVCALLPLPPRPETAAAPAGGRTRVLTADTDGQLRVWDAASGECLQVLDGHSDQVNSLNRLSDGRVVSTSHDQAAILWDLSSPVPSRPVPRHNAEVESLSLLSGARVFTMSTDGGMRVWDARRAAPLLELRGAAGQLERAAELADGRLLTASEKRRHGYQRARSESAWYYRVRVWCPVTGVCKQAVEDSGADPEEGRALFGAFAAAMERRGELNIAEKERHPALHEAVIKLMLGTYIDFESFLFSIHVIEDAADADKEEGCPTVLATAGTETGGVHFFEIVPSLGTTAPFSTEALEPGDEGLRGRNPTAVNLRYAGLSGRTQRKIARRRAPFFE